MRGSNRRGWYCTLSSATLAMDGTRIAQFVRRTATLLTDRTTAAEREKEETLIGMENIADQFFTTMSYFSVSHMVVKFVLST